MAQHRVARRRIITGQSCDGCRGSRAATRHPPTLARCASVGFIPRMCYPRVYPWYLALRHRTGRTRLSPGRLGSIAHLSFRPKGEIFNLLNYPHWLQARITHRAPNENRPEVPLSISLRVGRLHSDVKRNADYTLTDGMQNLKEYVNGQRHLIEFPDVARLLHKSTVRCSPTR